MEIINENQKKLMQRIVTIANSIERNKTGKASFAQVPIAYIAYIANYLGVSIREAAEIIEKQFKPQS
ncbi:MAG: hypothetical protein EHM34_03900 [Nitrosopumilales archaeon]|nr:MAG: hypothetical protein EHM34_03900 [Nitrosopumilales archaeon]